LTRLILHIGHPKTGTTALQSVLSANAATLLRAGVLYPTASDPGYHKHILSKPYLTGTENPTLHRRTGTRGDALAEISLRYWRRLRAECAATPHERLVLSCEGFFVRSERPDFRQRLGAICDHVTVAAYLRSPAKRVLSQMNQNLRMFREFVLPPAEYYRPVLETYMLGGFETLSLNVFDPAQMADGDIVTDFVRKYLPENLPPLVRDQVERSNESVSNEALTILAELPARWNLTESSRGDPRRGKAVALIRDADRRVGGTRRPSFKPEIAEAIVARSVDLPWLRDVGGVTFDDVDYAAIGRSDLPDLTGLRHVKDFCPVDPQRLAALRDLTDAPLARLYGGRLRGWVAAAGLG
jgi:hypothetical protein